MLNSIKMSWKLWLAFSIKSLEKTKYNCSVPPKVSTQKKPKAVEVDTSNIAVGTKIKHKAFGTGIITDKGQAYIFVNFDGQSVPKSSNFPEPLPKAFLRKYNKQGTAHVVPCLLYLNLSNY